MNINLSDSHCHFHPECTLQQTEQFAEILNSQLDTFPDKYFHLMTTQHLDLEFMDVLLTKLEKPKIIVPYFGIHPWFSHLFYIGNEEENLSKQEHYRNVLNPEPSEELLKMLPDPISVSHHKQRILEIIHKHNLKFFGIGEIGLDKLFRVPGNGYYGNLNFPLPQDQKLSPCRVKINHQLEIFKIFLDMASDLQKQVSLHCVKAHGMLFDNVKVYKDLTVILHSYTGSIQQAEVWLKTIPHHKLFFSLSNWINGEKSGALEDLVVTIPPRQILTESDIYVDRLFVEGKQEEYFGHLNGIYDKLYDFILIDSLQIHKNMLNSIGEENK
ncbi:hypothetical protein SBY92_000431 [Candida maltosa Xu316]|uniref:Uncharacterized protein n=1 Tax=Candida maltosa (strain Xu316) TaxID=1245528 RepID=M3K326_CANMX|nr:hypothetical protein G210_0191 [Candida maltosa Xu316]